MSVEITFPSGTETEQNFKCHAIMADLRIYNRSVFM